MTVCLVTIAIGEKYLEEYNRIFRSSQELYAKKHGYDFKVLTDYLGLHDISTVSMNKILVCSQDWSSKYEFIIFVDADILINPEAPAIHGCTEFGDKIGIVDEFSQPSFQKRVEFNRRMNWEPNASVYYRKAGLVIKTVMELNTGVLVMQPAKHGAFLKSIYDKYILKSVNHHLRFNYEQSVIGYELQTNNNFIVLPNIWNAVCVLYKYEPDFTLESFSKTVNFLHFAGLAANNGEKKSYNISTLYK